MRNIQKLEVLNNGNIELITTDKQDVILTKDDLEKLLDVYCRENDKSIIDRNTVKDYQSKTKKAVKNAFNILDEELEEIADLLCKSQSKNAPVKEPEIER